MADGVYEMFAKLSLDSTHMMAGLGLIGSKLTSLHADVGLLKTAFMGLGTALAAHEIVKGLEAIGKAGGEVNHQMNLMKALGMSMNDQNMFMDKAKETSFKVPTTNLSENLKHLQELRYIFGGPHEATEHIEKLSRINSIMNNIKGGGKDQVFDLAKGLEIKNETTNPQEFLAYANAMLRVVQASGGQVTASQFRNAIQYGRVSALGWDKEFIGGALGRMVQEYTASGGSGGGGSGGPGNALMSTFAALIQGKVKDEAAVEWKGLGFGNIQDKGISKANGRDLYMRNPYEWVQQFLMPALFEHGYKEKNDIIAVIGRLFGNRTASGIVANMATGGRMFLPGFNEHGDPNSPFEKDIILNKQARGEMVYDDLVKQDYPMLMEAFHKQFKNLLEVLGGELMQPGGPVIRAMASLTEMLTSTGKFFADNPKFVDGLLVALGGLAAALAALAGATVVAVLAMLAPTGLIVVGIAGLVGAIATLFTIKWSGLEMLKNGFNSVIGFFNALDEKLPGWMRGGKVGDPKIEKQSFQGGADGAPRLIPANFNPGSQKQILQPIKLELNVDGRQLAQTVSEAIQDLFNHSTGAASPNGTDQFTSADANFTST